MTKSLSNFLSTTEAGMTILAPTDEAFFQIPPANQVGLGWRFNGVSFCFRPCVINLLLQTKLRGDLLTLTKTLQLHMLSPRVSASKLQTADVGSEYATLAAINLEERKSAIPGKVRLGPEGSTNFTTIVAFSISSTPILNVHSVDRVLNA
eukprot:TRINITY_DN10046_c0_g2_i1.p1 TRINITY_DN10046_c0_g2~~TRINITY_DN10046_c0_g2_i1.p1  ORF type:complete len:150 (-),score=21.32 TRINITY_DN10046_c0_g2_i1:80-529(-)